MRLRCPCGLGLQAAVYVFVVHVRTLQTSLTGTAGRTYAKAGFVCLFVCLMSVCCMCVLGMFVCMSYVCMIVYHVCMYVCMCACSFAFQAKLSSCHEASFWEEGDPFQELVALWASHPVVHRR